MQAFQRRLHPAFGACGLCLAGAGFPWGEGFSYSSFALCMFVRF